MASHAGYETLVRYACVIASSSLCAFSLSFEDTGFLSFICLVPLFRMIDLAGDFKKILLPSFIWGALCVAGISYWVYTALTGHYGKTPLFAIAFMSITILAPAGILYTIFSSSAFFLKNNSAAHYAFVLPSLWVIMDVIREFVPIFVPWGCLGYAVAEYSYIVQIADIAGVHGLTFFIVMINALAAYGFKASFEALRSRRTGFIAIPEPVAPVRKFFIASVLIILSICAVVIYSRHSLRQWDGLLPQHMANRTVRAVVVQGSFGVKERWNDSSFIERIAVYKSLTVKAMAEVENSDGFLVIWPETVLNNESRMGSQFMEGLSGLVKNDGTLVAGGTRRGLNEKRYNTAWVINGNGDIGWYDKHILLPFAENNPCDTSVLGQFYTAPPRYEQGTASPVVKTKQGKLGISICFEIAYPHFIRGEAVSGAEMFVNCSNDSWFGDTSEPFQHHAMAIVRAIENRRFVLRASNSGISSIIAPTGKVFARTGLFNRSFISAAIAPVNVKPPYHTIGNIIPYCAMIIILVTLIRITLRM